MNATFPHIRPINRPLLRMCSEASQFIRLNGYLGWLTAPLNPCQDGYIFRKAFGGSVLLYSEGMFDTAEETTSDDLKAYYEAVKWHDEQLSAYYDQPNRNSGD